MRSRYGNLRAVPVLLSLAALAPHASAASIVLHGDRGEFTISREHGNLQSITAGDRAIAGPCADIYWWLDAEDKTVCDETTDVVTTCDAGEASVRLTCRIPALGIEVQKEYRLAAGGRALSKTVTVPRLSRPGILRVRSVVHLGEAFRQEAKLYCQRQSWTSSRESTLFGIRQARDLTSPVTSGAGWDDRLVAAWSAAQAIGHYRLLVRGKYVPPSSVIGAWGANLDHALRYTETGWDFELVHTMDGEPGPVDATVYYHLCSGDFRDLWREYRELPQFVEANTYPVPEWVKTTAAGGFWHLDPETTDRSLSDAHALATRLGDRSLPLGIFAWSLDGDYETEVPFLNEPGNLIVTPEWFAGRIAAFQSDSRVQMGAYIQGSLIDSATTAFAEHPEWAMQTAEGKPYFSGFRDNPLSEMHFVNILSPWAEHWLARVEAVCRRYDPGWIYLDGGAMFESTEYRLRRPLLPDQWMDLHRRLRQTVRSTGEQRGLLMNAQNHPYGDLYWLECPYFDAAVAWRDAVEFCYDTDIHHEPERAMLPLYWRDEPRYLALCVAFGFTPCLSGIPQNGSFSPAQWRAIDAAYWMRGARPVLTGGVVQPDWLAEDTDVIALPQRIGQFAVIPVLSMGEQERVRLSLSPGKLGLSVDAPLRVRTQSPLRSAKLRDLGEVQPQEGKLAVELEMETGWEGLTLVILGEGDLPLGRLPAEG